MSDTKVTHGESCTCHCCQRYDDGYPRDMLLARLPDDDLRIHAARAGGPAKDAAEAEIRFREAS